MQQGHGCGSYRSPERQWRGEVRPARAAATLIALSMLVACATPPAPAPAPPIVPVPELEVEPPREPAALPPCVRIVRIEVNKQSRTLTAECERGARVTLQAALGRRPEGTKRAAGDLRTPEGRYRISGPRQPSRFHGFLPIDYPSVDDAERAWAEGRISRGDLDRILDAHRRGTSIPADTPLGGGIGLHGEGERWRSDSVHLDWTYGCIAVSDADLDFLTERLARGVPVIIRP